MLIQVGCEARKTPAVAVVFLLDFSFYRTNRDFRAVRLIRLSKGVIFAPDQLRIRFQSFFILITTQPFDFASS